MALTERLALLVTSDMDQPRKDFRGLSKDADKLDRSVGKTSKGLDRVGIAGKVNGAMLKAGIAGGAAVAGAALFQFGKTAVDVASDTAEANSKVGVVFGASAGKIRDFAKDSASSFGISKRATLEYTGTLGNLLVSTGLAQDASADMSLSMVKLAGDMASFNNASIEDTLGAIRSGLVGETEPLKRFGVNLNEAAFKQKALDLGLVKTATTTLPAAAKAQAAYALITEQTGTAQGDFARTSDGLANKQRLLAASVEDLTGKIGQGLVPVLTDATDGLITFVDAAEDVGGAFDRLPKPLKDAAIKLFLLSNGVTAVADTWSGLKDTFGDGEEFVIMTEKTHDFKTLLDGTAPSAQRLGTDFAGLARVTYDVARASEEAAAQQDRQRQATEKLLNATLAGIDSSLAYRQAQDAASDALRDIADKERDLAKARKAHGKSSREARDAAEALSDAELDLEGRMIGAAKAAERVALENSKATDAQAKARQGSQAYRDELARQAETLAPGSPLRRRLEGWIATLDEAKGVRKAEVRLDTRRAHQSADALERRLGRIDDEVVNVIVRYPNGRPIKPAERAHGGPVKAGYTYKVGELGEELFEAPADGWIHPHGSYDRARAVAGRSAVTPFGATDAGRTVASQPVDLSDATVRKLARLMERMNLSVSMSEAGPKVDRYLGRAG